MSIYLVNASCHQSQLVGEPKGEKSIKISIPHSIPTKTYILKRVIVAGIGVAKAPWNRFGCGPIPATVLAPLGGVWVKKKKDEIVQEAELGKYEGDVELPLMPHGHGIIRDSFGNVYKGEWQCGVMQGSGYMTFVNGRSYEGTFNKGVIDGHGTMVYPERAQYEGEWRLGVREGNGVMITQNNNKYEGEWLDDQCYGFGVEKENDIATYTGNWHLGHRHPHSYGIRDYY